MRRRSLIDTLAPFVTILILLFIVVVVGHAVQDLITMRDALS